MQKLVTYIYPLGQESEMVYEHSKNIEAWNREGWRAISIAQSIATFADGSKQGLLLSVLLEKED